LSISVTLPTQIGYDERIMLAGVKLARKIAEQSALRSWVKRELAPGLAVQDDKNLSEHARRAANTVYHPAGTCRMGAASDPLAVVDPTLRVRGVDRLRVADASIFPAMIRVPTVRIIPTLIEPLSERAT
jgi:choline dehydrogenase-like flavoprotein